MDRNPNPHRRTQQTALPTVAAPAVPAVAPQATGGLASAAEVEALADHLTACANALHERIMAEIHRCRGRPVPAAAQGAARALLDNEQMLRQRANGLYTDAARCIVAALGTSQRHVMDLTADAAGKIRAMARIGDGIGLVAHLLGLAAAASTGQATPVILALERLRQQLDAITLHEPPAPPA